MSPQELSKTHAEAKKVMTDPPLPRTKAAAWQSTRRVAAKVDRRAHPGSRTSSSPFHHLRSSILAKPPQSSSLRFYISYASSRRGDQSVQAAPTGIVIRGLLMMPGTCDGLLTYNVSLKFCATYTLRHPSDDNPDNSLWQQARCNVNCDVGGQLLSPVPGVGTHLASSLEPPASTSRTAAGKLTRRRMRR